MLDFDWSNYFRAARHNNLNFEFVESWCINDCNKSCQRLLVKRLRAFVYYYTEVALFIEGLSRQSFEYRSWGFKEFTQVFFKFHFKLNFSGLKLWHHTVHFALSIFQKVIIIVLVVGVIDGLVTRNLNFVIFAWNLLCTTKNINKMGFFAGLAFSLYYCFTLAKMLTDSLTEMTAL